MTSDLCEVFSELPEVPRIERLTLKPGDRLVLTFQQYLDDEQYDRVAEQVKMWGFPHGGVIILDGGATLQVLEAVPC